MKPFNYFRMQNFMVYEQYAKAAEYASGYLSSVSVDPEAEAYLGYLYINGLGVEKDSSRGAEMIRRATVSGSIYGKFFTEICRYFGYGIPKDEKTAISRVFSYSQDNSLRDDYHVKYRHDAKGIETELFLAYIEAHKQDYSESLSYSRNENKLIESLLSGRQYECPQQEKCPQDYEYFMDLHNRIESRREDLLRSGCCLGYWDTRNALFFAQETTDWALKAKYARMAAMDGNPTATIILSGLYEKGAGVPLDLDEAIHLMKCADESGVYDCRKEIKRLKALKKGKALSPVTPQRKAAYVIPAENASVGEKTSIPSGNKGRRVLSSEEIFKVCAPAVVKIIVYNAQGGAECTGTGFLVASGGVMVTCFHVIQKMARADVEYLDGHKGVVKTVIRSNKDADWAVVRISGAEHAPVLHITDSCTPGEEIYTIGCPIGLSQTIAEGLISNTNLNIDGNRKIQISAPISGGSSGGALINRFGEVVGITAASFINGQNLNIVIPIKEVNL